MGEQLDWIGIEDRLAARRRLLAESVKRIGLTQIAHHLGEDPSTVDNQIARRGPKRPSSDLADLCEEIDPERGSRHRKAKAPADATPPATEGGTP